MIRRSELSRRLGPRGFTIALQHNCCGAAPQLQRQQRRLFHSTSSSYASSAAGSSKSGQASAYSSPPSGGANYYNSSPSSSSSPRHFFFNFLRNGSSARRSGLLFACGVISSAALLALIPEWSVSSPLTKKKNLEEYNKEIDGEIDVGRSTTSSRPLSRRAFAAEGASHHNSKSTTKPTIAPQKNNSLSSPSSSPPFDYKGVVKDLENLFDDDLSLAPAAVRLAWHAAGSWDAKSKDGGSNTATMRFEKEGKYAANNGLERVRVALESVKKKHPQISYADLWVLAAFTAISSAMGGPEIPFKWGRKDAADDTNAAPPDRLPDGSKTQEHVRCVFNRMGFDDLETTALLGAHAVGECHREYSGYVGPWTFEKYTFSNQYYTTLLENEWVVNAKEPVLQFTDAATKTLLMMPGDIAFLIDPKFRSICETFAKDPELWAKSFTSAFSKLMEFNTSNLQPITPSK